MQYNEFVVEQILGLIADGYSLERIYNEIEGMPSRSTFLKWRRADDALSARYEKAIQDRVAYSFDRLSDIAFKLLDPEDRTYRTKATEVRAATDILLKLLSSATAISGIVGADEKRVAHIKVELVKATEEKPPEAG
jgi:hypothetical protein